MNLEQFIRDLNEGWVKVVDQDQRVSYVERKRLVSSFYFWSEPRWAPPYDVFSGEELTKKLNKIIRIEIPYENDYYPVWTKEDGVIDLNEKFVRLNGRFYTIPFLEDLIRKVGDFKKINI